MSDWLRRPKWIGDLAARGVDTPVADARPAGLVPAGDRATFAEPQAAAADAARIELSLISHTNAGKTTLARTLLDRDVGEVRDAAHVTATADPYPMIDTPQGDALQLWDTPGFGDSVRLAARLAQQGNPIGWFLTQVWDRWRDRPLWSSQQAMRNVREQADVVLYLVNASEDPADAGYLEPELRILAWIGKPVVVLLNQLGQPLAPADEDAEQARWRAAFASRGFVHAVLPLDAFARCWVQEVVLLREVGRAVPADKQPAFARLQAAWQARRLALFEASMQALADQLAQAACDREPVDDALMRGALRDMGRAIGLGGAAETSKDRAMRALATRLENGVRTVTDRLIALHGLDGHAAEEVIARLARSYASAGRVNEGKAAMVGGFVSGALSGLVADLASGGLTFGAGLLAGGVLGALGAAGLARGFNLVRGEQQAAVAWSDELLDELVRSALLRYLAVAHYGRGRGQWTQSEHPAHWRGAVEAAVAQRRAEFAAVWGQRRTDGGADRLAELLRPTLAGAGLALLERLYPGALDWSSLDRLPG